MLSQPLIQRTLGSNSLKASSLELSEGLNYPGGLPLLVSVGEEAALQVVVSGFKAAEAVGWGVEQAPRCHPRPASSCSEEVACLQLCLAFLPLLRCLLPLAQETGAHPWTNWRPESSLSVPGAKWWASVSSVLCWNLKMRVL